MAFNVFPVLGFLSCLSHLSDFSEPAECHSRAGAESRAVPAACRGIASAKPDVISTEVYREPAEAS